MNIIVDNIISTIIYPSPLIIIIINTTVIPYYIYGYCIHLFAHHALFSIPLWIQFPISIIDYLWVVNCLVENFFISSFPLNGISVEFRTLIAGYFPLIFCTYYSTVLWQLLLLMRKLLRSKLCSIVSNSSFLSGCFLRFHFVFDEPTFHYNIFGCRLVLIYPALDIICYFTFSLQFWKIIIHYLIKYCHRSILLCILDHLQTLSSD